VSLHISKEKFSALKGILFVSALIRLVGSGSPIGPRHWKWGCSVGITILSLNTKGLKVGRTKRKRKEKY
jgi:hypothetical protein